MKVHKRLVLRALRVVGFDAVRRGPDLLLLRRGRPPSEQDRGFRNFVLGEHVAHLLHQLRVNCVLDVGANHGQYALELRRAGYGGEIISFEPVREAFEELCERSRRDAKWRVHPFALGARETTARIHVASATLYSSFLETNAYAEERVADSSRIVRSDEVPIRRLDMVFDEVTAHVPDRRCFLKMDTQGFDLEVFRGLGDRVAEVHGLQSEISAIPIYEGAPQMLEMLASYGRHGFGLTGLFPIARDSRTSRVIEFDCVMVRAPETLDPGGGGTERG